MQAWYGCGENYHAKIKNLGHGFGGDNRDVKSGQ